MSSSSVSETGGPNYVRPNFPVKSSARSQRNQAIMVSLLICCALVTLGTTLGIIYMLIKESMGFFAGDDINLWEFLTGTKWSVGRTQGKFDYGIWPLLSGTLRITAIAMVLALPLGLVTAIYLSEYAPKSVRAILKPTLEILAGIPTVVLGFFAVKFITPNLLAPLGEFKTFNATAAGIAVGILCIPLVASLAEDALRAVPRALREGAYGLGSTKLETTLKVIVPAALSGIISAFLLAVARAIGETMVVALAAGSSPTFTMDPRGPSQTMTGFIVHTFQSESVVPGTPGYYSIYAVAALLFLITFGITLIGQIVRMRYREEYN
jgi:phosphate transport system permease protein